MRCIAVSLAVLIFALAVGCGSKSATDQLPPPPSQSQPEASLPKERATTLAKQMREAMTTPSIMQVPVESDADTDRRRKQIRAAQALIRKLIECGKAAEEPLWQLINDSDESVRRTSVILLNWRDNNWKIDEKGNLIESQALIDLTIPLLERALASKDSQVRYFACAGLGDSSDFSDECLERLKTSVPKLRELRNDSDEKVRNIGGIARTMILGKLSERAKNPEDRKAASEELERMKQEKK